MVAQKKAQEDLISIVIYNYLIDFELSSL